MPWQHRGGRSWDCRARLQSECTIPPATASVCLHRHDEGRPPEFSRYLHRPVSVVRASGFVIENRPEVKEVCSVSRRSHLTNLLKVIELQITSFTVAPSARSKVPAAAFRSCAINGRQAAED